MRILGVLILLSCFGLLFAITAQLAGWRTAVAIWLASILVTALITLGIGLATGEMSI